MEEKGEYIIKQTKSLQSDYLISKTIAENTIPYRPSIRPIAGGIASTILLRQIMYWWGKMDGKPYYKFFKPTPDNDKYKKGQSWEEDLKFSYSEIQTALKKFALKITKGINKTEAAKEYVVIYWTDSDRLTWFQFNPDVFELLYKPTTLIYLENNKSQITYPITVSQITSLTVDNHKITSNGAKNKNAPVAEIPQLTIKETIEDNSDLFEEGENNQQASAQRAQTQAALLRGAQAQADNGAIDLSWLQEYLRPLAQAFVDAAGENHEPIKADYSLWRKTLSTWFALKLAPQDVTNAVQYMRDPDNALTIGGIQSVTKTARDRKGGQEEIISTLPKITSETKFN